jgi:hypothetical protein
LRLDLAERDFQLGLVEQIALKGQLLAAGTKAPLPRQAQLLFHQPEQLLLLGDDPGVLGNEVIFLLDQVVFSARTWSRSGTGADAIKDELSVRCVAFGMPELYQSRAAEWSKKRLVMHLFVPLHQTDVVAIE